MMQQGFGTETNPYMYHCFWKSAINSQYLQIIAMVILNVILNLRHKNILNNQLYVKYVILIWFLFFIVYWAIFERIFCILEQNQNTMMGIEKNEKKPKTQIALPEGRFFSTFCMENIKKCAQKPSFRLMLSYSSG